MYLGSKSLSKYIQLKTLKKIKPPGIRKILINNTKIINKNNSKKRLQILEAITINIKKKPSVNKTAFNTSINI